MKKYKLKILKELLDEMNPEEARRVLVAVLFEENKRLEKQLEIAVEALEFYGAGTPGGRFHQNGQFYEYAAMGAAKPFGYHARAALEKLKSLLGG